LGGHAGTTGLLSAPNSSMYAGGGGFYGDASEDQGGDGGYLGHEGKGGDGCASTDGCEGNGGILGGGGGAGCNGGFGAGAGSISGSPGQFGGGSGMIRYIGRYEFFAGGGAGLGGAVFIREYGTFTASHCVFQKNIAEGGNGTIAFPNTTSRYSGQGKGGAIFVHNSNATLSLSEVFFSENSAENSTGEFLIANKTQDTNDLYGSFSTESPFVTSINFYSDSQGYNAVITFLVTFNRDVVGVDTQDFYVETDNSDDTHITSVDLVDAQTYRVNISKTRGAGFIILHLIDNDTITDPTERFPLGQTGHGNGNYSSNEYRFTHIHYIDSILPITGVFADYGTKIKNGITLAVKDINVDPIQNGFWSRITCS
jgi:hypothetical protein